MINFLKTPKNIDFTGNELAFEIKANKYIKTEGTYAHLKFRQPSTFWYAWDIILFDFDSNSIKQILVLDNPNEETNEIKLHPNNSSVTYQNQFNALQLASLDFVNKHYKIFFDGEFVNIVTREKVNIDWSTTTNNFPNLPADTQFEIISSGASPVYEDEFSIVGNLNVYLNDSLEKLIDEFEIQPDEHAKSIIRLGSLLSDYIKPELPDFNTTIITEINLFKYRVQFAEKYLVNSALRINTASVFEGFALRGKVDFNKYPDFDIVHESSIQKSYLNQFDDKIYLWSDAVYYLNFLKTGSSENINLKAQIYYTDRTIVSVTIESFNDAQENNIYRFPCSINTLELNNYNPEKEIYRYNLALFNSSDEQLSKWANFILIDKPLFNHEFLFLNSYGVYEVFNAKGTKSKFIDIKRESYNKNPSPYYRSSDAEIIGTVEKAQEFFEVKTGSLSKQEAEYLISLLISEDFYEIINQQYIRCELDAGKYEINPNQEDLFELEFKYKYAFYK